MGNNDIHRRQYMKILTPPFHQASDDMDFENCSMKHEGGGAIDDDDVDNDVDDIYIMMSVCVSVCHEKSSLPPWSLL